MRKHCIGENKVKKEYAEKLLELWENEGAELAYGAATLYSGGDICFISNAMKELKESNEALYNVQ